MAAVLVSVVLGYAWFLGDQFTAPLRPGEQVGRLLKRAGFAGGPNLMAALFVLSNVLFWFLVFFCVSLVARHPKK